jgi:transposase-like protein
MKRTRDGRRRFTRDFKIAGVRRVLKGEDLRSVAQDLQISYGLLWRWKKRVVQEGEEHLYDIGRRSGGKASSGEASKQRRIAELERLVGRQQLEIRFLDKALRRVEELGQEKNVGGGAASSKR